MVHDLEGDEELVFFFGDVAEDEADADVSRGGGSRLLLEKVGEAEGVAAVVLGGDGVDADEEAEFKFGCWGGLGGDGRGRAATGGDTESGIGKEVGEGKERKGEEEDGDGPRIWFGQEGRRSNRLFHFPLVLVLEVCARSSSVDKQLTYIYVIWSTISLLVELTT